MIKDLISVSQTCKQLQQVAESCFQQMYPSDVNITELRACCKNVEHTAYTHNIVIYGHQLKSFLKTQSKFLRPKKIELIQLDSKHLRMIIKQMKPTLSKVTILRMDKCCFDIFSNFHHLISLCPHLKRLEVTNCFLWFKQKFPTLHSFLVTDFMGESPIFLKRNPNILEFAIDSEIIWENRDIFLESNIKLDELFIVVMSRDLHKLNFFYRFLNELQVRGFYKRLKLEFCNLWNQEAIEQLATFNGLVELVIVNDGTTEGSFTLSGLKNLEELDIYDGDVRHVNFEILANNLPNIKRFRFQEVSIDQIMLLFEHSVKLQTIEIIRLIDGINYSEDTHVIDLLELNEKRKRLPDAKKITLYVDEKIYLATKWALGETNFGLIRLKRYNPFTFKNLN